VVDIPRRMRRRECVRGAMRWWRRMQAKKQVARIERSEIGGGFFSSNERPA
jgi:hypothetical protein